MPNNVVDDLWIRRFQPAPESELRLVCLPHAGGAASYYLELARAVAPEIEVLALQYPGRQDRRREPLVPSVTALADDLYEVLARAVEPPFAIFGHSMGAILGFEVARRFHAAAAAGGGGTGPVRLLVSGRRAPSRGRDETVHTRDDAGVLAELREVGGTDPRVLAEPELRASILAVLRNDYRAIETYRCPPGPPLDCPITVLVGDRDPKTTLEEASAWAEHTTGPCDLRVFPGGHFYLDERRAEVTAAITQSVRTSDDGSPR
ncbi:thioesterase II family protein [Actinomadura opuntiae]|uniref:thioesterase II family protein n=1 Tax=Actinomadura sp. OS1-43 TaxID=604315 RepID=UPI00255AD812|nr:alpha/beta fold hydrolase [Actinomadura sp. OS1-43]MDL4815416.1 alpha/beta fold hydrolase [Actinomadura sp. OS1-43]